MASKRTQRPINEELPEILARRGMSVRELARRTEVSSTHLSRALRGAKYKSIGGELAGGLAVALDLPIDYFVEYREALVVNAVREDPALRERLYNRLKR